MINLLLVIFSLVPLSIHAYTNVLDTELKTCSSDGMARTGFMRDGHCTEIYDDRGSHHICIGMVEGVFVSILASAVSD